MLGTYIKEFGPWLLLVTSAGRVMRMLGCNNKLLYKYDKFKHKIIIPYLWKKYNKTINLELPSPIGNFENFNYAFVFWWQGEESAPEIVKTCIKSIRKNHKGKVIVLSENNYTKYSNIPEYIIQKMKQGKMSLTHFSDILRYNLLYNWGGAWIDATCLLTKPIPEKYYQTEYFSLKDAYFESTGFNWTNFYMHIKQGHIMAKQMLNFFYSYWAEHNCLLTYLLVDCWQSNLYRHTDFKQIINKMPKEGKDVFRVTTRLNEEYDKKKWAKIDTYYIYKLTYKQSFNKYTKDGKLTNYGYIIRQYS